MFLVVFQKSCFSLILAVFTTFRFIISKFSPCIATFALFSQIWVVSSKYAQFQAYYPHFDEINGLLSHFGPKIDPILYRKPMEVPSTVSTITPREQIILRRGLRR